MNEELVQRLNTYSAEHEYHGGITAEAADVIQELSQRVPLVPHGRLIDADALKEKHHWTDDFYETEYVEVEDIDAAPTIIPAEVDIG